MIFSKELNVCRVKVFSEAYPEISNYLFNKTKIQPSRNGDTKELLNFKTEITNPIQRCVGGYNRNINVFFLLAEAMWIYVGRKDVNFLTIFNKKMADYSDDGTVFHAPYGYRIRNWGISSGSKKVGFDQLRAATELLDQNNDSRQIVISIWNPDLDLNSDAIKDRPCLAGDMKFCSPEGNFTIKEIFDRLNSGEISAYPVYSWDEKKDKIIIHYVDDIIFTGKKKTIKITLENGATIRVTTDHRMYKRTRTGNYMMGELKVGFKIVEAGELKVGDTLLSDVFSEGKKGHLCHKKHLFQNTNHKNKNTIHREYYEWLHSCKITEGFDIHHINENKQDNSALNLEMKEHGQHSRDHKWAGDNPIHKESDEKRRLRLFKRRASLKKRGWDVPVHEDDFIYEELKNAVELQDKKIKKEKPRNSSKIVAIEEYLVEDVYDFHVPGYHNALFENGAVIHNCNDMLMYKIRDNELLCTIQNRSNDLHWGLPTNLFQFSFIGEIMSEILGVQLGTQTHNSQSLHYYTSNQIAATMYSNSTNEDSGSAKNLYHYTKAEQLKMNINFGGAETANAKISNIDYWVHQIINNITLLNKGDKKFDKQLTENLEAKFSLFFAYAYELLCIYVEYKNSNVSDGERVNAINNILQLREWWPTVKNTDYELLALNFFFNRIKDPELLIATINNFKLNPILGKL
jgi:thymidylate synthase